jgi:hypothetical protein
VPLFFALTTCLYSCRNDDHLESNKNYFVFWLPRSLRQEVMYGEIRHDSSGLRDLLNKWKDCPDVFRALLLDGVEQLDLLSQDPPNYAASLYPRWFFEFACSGCVCALDKAGGSLQGEIPSMLWTAWNSLQLSININKK